MTGRPDRCVVDASVAIKWLIDEDGSDAALALQGTELAAPALLRIEAANVLRTLTARDRIAAATARELFALLQTAPVSVVEHDDRLEARALALALELDHPIYDCVYLALAERLAAVLVTADLRFLRRIAASPHADRAVSLEDAAAG